MSTDYILKAKDAIQESFEWGELTWYAGARLGNSDALTVGQCRIKPGQANPRHYHPNCEEILYVVQGEILHTMGDESLPMHAGDTIVIPVNLMHNARNVGDEEAVLFITFSPANRETIGE